MRPLCPQGRLAGSRRGLLHLFHHLLGHAKAHGHGGGHGGCRRAFTAAGHGLAHLVLHIVVEVANGAHAGALVDGLFHFGRYGDVLQHEAGHLDAVLLDHGRVDDLHQRLAQVAIARGHVQHRHLGLGQGLGEDADDARAHGVGKLVDAEVLVRARHFLEEQRGLHDAEVVGAEGADAHHAKVLVAHQHGVGGAPLVAREQARVDVVDVALEGRLETVLPAQDGGQHGHVLGAQRVLAGAEQVGVLAGGHELHLLRFAHDQLGAVLDFLVVVRPAVGERVARVIGPFDDLDQLVLDDVEQVHATPRPQGYRKKMENIVGAGYAAPGGGVFKKCSCLRTSAGCFEVISIESH